MDNIHNLDSFDVKPFYRLKEHNSYNNGHKLSFYDSPLFLRLCFAHHVGKSE